VGADIVSGILATQLYRGSGTVLFIDVGTNGEMVVAHKGKLFATSTAAGPAFEGMNIEHGMRAAKGAIERFELIGGRQIIGTIGGVEPIGICGSGLFDIVGELVKSGKINARGQLEGKAYHITDTVNLTQNDVRQVQLAKGAVRAGVDALLDNVGATTADVDKVLIAGSFGYHLRPESLVNIGIIPPELGDKLQFVGNTSKTGGRAFLLNHNFRGEMTELANRVKVVELATQDGFDRLFIKSMKF
jgi:uncharacterized 2Fe-2S/4Fe-4S cluster protein (DUF4445 family)